jgi:hypothetical protein
MKHMIGAGWLRSGTRLNTVFYDGTRKSRLILTIKLTRRLGLLCV